MTRTALPAALVGLLLAFLPPALAQDEARPDDAAWVDDCPPDMACAYGGEGCIECSGPSEGGAQPGQALGAEGCIDCMTPPGEAPAQETKADEAESRDVAAPSLLAALGIMAVAALAVAMLGRR